MTNPTPFEHVACGRCGGSGQYSFNLMHGSKCYGCAGAGVVFTKRGKAARDWMRKQRSVRADQVVVGQRLFFDMFFWRGWMNVSEVARSDNGNIRISCIRRNGEINTIEELPESLLIAAVSKERHAELIAQAVEYQNSLNEDGTSSERAIRA